MSKMNFWKPKGAFLINKLCGSHASRSRAPRSPASRRSAILVSYKNTVPVSFCETGNCPVIYTASIVGPPSPAPCSILFSFRLTCSAVSDAHPANRDMFCILSDFHPCGTASLPFLLAGSDFYEFISSIFIWQSRRDHVLIQLCTMVSPPSLYVNSGFMGISRFRPSGLSLFQASGLSGFSLQMLLQNLFFMICCLYSSLIHMPGSDFPCRIFPWSLFRSP